MPNLDAAFVAQATSGRLSGQAPESPFAGVGSDSRNIAEGQLFVALAGPNFDGHDYVASALAAGAAGAHGDDFALLGLFLGGVGDDDPAPNRLLLLDTADQNAVGERPGVHGFPPP
jgi:hypothetical protein